MHTFCYDCITEAVRHSPQCPIDRLPLSTEDLSSSNPIVKHVGTSANSRPMIQSLIQFLSQLVDELLVECLHSSAGCTHICQRQLLESHLKHACPYVTVPCPEIDCDQSVLRKDCGKHADVCVHRPTTCRGCGVSVKYGSLNVSLRRTGSMIDNAETKTRITILSAPQKLPRVLYALPSFQDQRHWNTLPLARTPKFLASTSITGAFGQALATNCQVPISRLAPMKL